MNLLPILIAGLAGAIATMLSLLLAIWSARRIARPIEQIEQGTHALGLRRTMTFSNTGLPEADRTLDAIATTARVLEQHDKERDEREAHVRLIMRELSHRSKNLLAVVQSVARQVAKHARSFDDFEEAFSARIGALAATHDLLVTRNWQGADIREAIDSQLAPFRQTNEARFILEGPSLVLKPKAVEHLGLALHELATNATKYGALSVPTGSVKLSWALEPAGESDQQLRMVWSEIGGPCVRRSEHEGFGHAVITRVAPKALEGSAEVVYAGEGLQWILKAPIASILEESPSA